MIYALIALCSLCFVSTVCMIIIVIQMRELAKAFLYANSIDSGVEYGDTEPQQAIADYTQNAPSLAELLNQRLAEAKLSAEDVQAAYDFEPGVEVVTYEDELRYKE